MKIKRVEIIGFKSFCDRAVVQIGESITGVVGPNGCGKSNIVDAIRWCMGEQSAKHLRGKAMEDVIFAGSETRGPAPMAEVSLTFDEVGFSAETLELARNSDEAETERAIEAISTEDPPGIDAAALDGGPSDGSGADGRRGPIDAAAEAIVAIEAAPEEVAKPNVWVDAEGNPIASPQEQVAAILDDAPPAIDFSRYTEVTITRRLFRDGISQYFINKTPCRLRDITDFFLGTGVGTKAYAIIEQGRIGQIVSSRPQDRRAIIEEAAGITKFKAKKKAAEKKLEQTRQNLMRVSDIVTELDKRMGSLRRQAQKAERYRKYKAEVRDIELWKASHRWLELSSEQQLVTGRLDEARLELEEARTAWTTKDAHLIAERAELGLEERRLHGIQEVVYELDNRIRLGESKIGFERREAEELDGRVAGARTEIDDLAAQRAAGAEELATRAAELATLEEDVARETAEVANREGAAAEARTAMAEAQTQLDAARAELGGRRMEIATADAQLESQSRRREEAQRRLERVLGETEQHAGRTKELDKEFRRVSDSLVELRQTRLDLGSQRENFEARRELLAEEATSGEADVSRLKSELVQRTSRLTSLQEIQARFEGLARGTRAVMEGASAIAPGEPGAIRGIVADVVRASERYEVAVETALGDRLGGVIVRDSLVAVDAVSFLKRGAGGRSSFVPVTRGVTTVAADTTALPEVHRQGGEDAKDQGTKTDVAAAADASWSEGAPAEPVDSSESVDSSGSVDSSESVDSSGSAVASESVPATTLPEGAPTDAGFEGESGPSSWVSQAWDGERATPGVAPVLAAPLPAMVAEVPHVLPVGEGVLGWMADLVSFADGFETVGRRLVEHIIVVDTLANAIAAQAAGATDKLVTLEGDVVHGDGVVAGGSRDASGAGVLAQKREIRDLEEMVGALEHELAEAQARLHTAKQELKQVQMALEGLRKQAHEGDIAIMSHEKDEVRVRADLDRARDRLTQLNAEQLELEERLRVIASDEQATRERKAAAEDRIGELERIQLDRISDAHMHRERLESVQAVLTEARIRAAQLGAQRAAAESATLRLQRADADLAARAERLIAEIADSEQRADALRTACEALATELAAVRTDRDEQVKALDEGRQAYQDRTTSLVDVEMAVRELRRRSDELATESSTLDVRRGQIDLTRRVVEEQIDERYQLDMPTVVQDYHQRALITDAEEARLAELRELIERMGADINLTAIEEFAEVSTRFEFLSAQKNDLERAVDQLQRAIDKINATSRKLFKDTFDAVNATFKQVYPRLFRGGQASLSLTMQPERGNKDAGEGEVGEDGAPVARKQREVDLLEAGIEIMAQPPGKKNSTVEQLSGGEKALTAVALVFSIFLIKPSPFCILDEVDAPLDEANVDRYNEIVREMTDRSQFIVITHNKRTMEAADNLYGVTMQEPGVSKLVSVNLSRMGQRAGTATNRQSAPASA